MDVLLGHASEGHLIHARAGRWKIADSYYRNHCAETHSWRSSLNGNKVAACGVISVNTSLLDHKDRRLHAVLRGISQ